MRGLVLDAEWAPRPGYPIGEQQALRRSATKGSQVWRNPRWEVGKRPDPELSNPEDVLIRTRACGLCGSDVHMFETDDAGYVLLAYRMRLPIAVGHEFAGEVIEVGSAVTSLRVDDAVAVEAQRYCNNCRACLQGQFNQCEHGEDLGFTLDGGTGEYVVAPERHCYSLNELREERGEQATYEIGALVEPTSIAYHGMVIRAGGFRPGAHVAVFGCGPVGLAAVGLARAAGAAKIIAIDIQPERRELALGIGADRALNPVGVVAAGATVGGEILELTRGAGVDMAVEATGAGSAVMADVEQALALSGRVVLIGVESGHVPVRTIDLQMKGAQVFGALGHLGGGFEAAINLFAARRMDLSTIVTARFGLPDGVAAIERATARRDAKIIIDPTAR